MDEGGGSAMMLMYLVLQSWTLKVVKMVHFMPGSQEGGASSPNGGVQVSGKDLGAGGPFSCLAEGPAG